MVTGSTLDLSKQAELTIITADQISDLSEGSAIIYRKTNEVGNLIPALGFVSKDGTVTDLPYPGTEIKGLIVPPIPNTFPGDDKAYALGLVEVSGDFELKWVLVDTDGNFNRVPPSYYYTTRSSAVCYNYDADLNDLFLNGSLLVQIYGWDVNTPKKYSIDGGSTFSGIVTEQYDDDGNSYFTIQNLGITNPTGQTIDLVIADSADNILYPNQYSVTGTTIINSPTYDIQSSYEGLDNNGAFDVNLVKLQDISLTSRGTMEVVVTDIQIDCEYYYEIWDSATSTLLFYRDYSTEKTYEFGFTTGDTQLFAVVYKKTPGRVFIEGVDIDGFGTIDIQHYSLMYSKGDPNPANFVNITPGANSTSVIYSPNEADGVKELYMKTSGDDCIYFKPLSFTQDSNSITTADMLTLDYSGDTISNFLFDYPIIGNTIVNTPLRPNTYFDPVEIKAADYSGGTSIILSYTFLGTVSTGDTNEILFYDAVSGQPILTAGVQTSTTTPGGYVTIDLKYLTYWTNNSGKSIMIRFKYTNVATSGDRTYYSDLIHIKND
jgi:hypothetical protein